jgi:hypothetical protein
MKLHILNPKGTKPDIFDRVGKDIFDRTELEPEDKVLNSPEFATMLEKAVQKAVAAIKLPEPVQVPQKETVREIRVEVPSKDSRDLVERKELAAALKKIAELEKQLEETDRRARSPIVLPGGSGVIGIPPPEAVPENYVLTRNAQGKAEWKASQGGNGNGLTGMSSLNHAELLTFDETDTSLDELAKVVGTIIDQLS